MATKLNADISTNVDITCRKNDNLYLVATVKNSDDSIFDLTNYTLAEFLVLNSNDNTVRKFSTASSTTSPPIYYNTITRNVTLGTLSLNADGGMMSIPEGSYNYTLKITGSDGSGSSLIATILHGKFKVID